jgi:cytochrome d ubiquinol oxidase subunit II
MGFIWFWLVAIMIVGYVVFDGFDLGVGVLHLFLARNESERRSLLRSIGPVWDGNEVWLLAGGGTLYFAFPLLYASAFSGFYLPLMIVLWLLVLRGVSLELRNHIDVGVWRSLLDGLFGISSTLLTIFYGAALANVIRGVPLRADGYFFLPLWTNWRPGAFPGILDWYTIIGGLVALVALTMHGSPSSSRATSSSVRAASSIHSGTLSWLSPSSASSPPSQCARRPSRTTTTTRSRLS